MKYWLHILFFLFFTKLSNVCFSQLCEGSLSDPIISIDYGERGPGGSFYGNPLPSGQTTYNYISRVGLEDGEYTITTNPNRGRLEWHNSPDHSINDDDGYLLLVNASQTAGEFYRARVTDLCEETLFVFSAWVMNVLPPGICNVARKPNIRFEIRTTAGNLIASSSTGEIPERNTPVWVKHGVSFNTGAYTEVDLIMINNGPGGCGNDLAIDDIEFRACGDEASIFSDINIENICANNIPDSIDLEAQIDGNVYDNPFFQWQHSLDGVNWTSIPDETATQITVSPVNHGEHYRYLIANSLANLSNGKCRVNSESKQINILPPSTWSIIGPDEICDNEPLTLNIAGSSSIQEVTWLLPNHQEITGNNLTIDHGALSGLYQATIVDENNCTYSVSKSVQVNETTTTSIDIKACKGTSIQLINGENYTIQQNETIERIVPKRSNGCDSILQYNLVAHPLYNQVTDTIVCENSPILNPEGSMMNIVRDTVLLYTFSSIWGCDSLVTKKIKVPQETNVSKEVCENDLIRLPDGRSIQASHSFQETYNLNAQQHSCDSIVNFTVNVKPNSQIDEDVVGCPFQPLTLPDGTSVRNEGLYTRRFVSANGCDSLVSYHVRFNIDSCSYEDLCFIQFPNSITPNNNNKNDWFKPLFPPICHYENYTLKIYNRWGETVFLSHDPNEYWQLESSMKQSVFLWTVFYNLVLEDGSHKEETYSGTIQVIQ